MPLARAWMGLWKWQTSPSTRTSPSVGGKFPAISLTRVDLPAPLSPINPTTSPGSTDQLMSFTAWIAPKLFDTLRTSSRATPAPHLSCSSSGCLQFDYSIIAGVPWHLSGNGHRAYSIACHVRDLDDRTAVSMIF